jgi:hypothetical protein
LSRAFIDVVVEDHDEPGFGGEVEDAIERRVGEAGRVAGDLRRHELLVDAELADAAEDAGERLQHAADVIHRVHVRRIEPGDHRIEPRLLGFWQRPVGHRDEGIGERVVVERRVALQVVRGRELAGVAVRPLLLQRNAEERRALHARAHDLQEVTDVDPLLDVVGQVEVRVVELVRGVGGRLRRRQQEDDSQNAERAGHHRTAQKFNSKLRWNTGPLAPTG